jgi:poly(3-hydroxybutyrate) depolymerase
MALRQFVAAIAACACVSAPALAQKSEKHTTTFAGRQRTYLTLPVAPGGEPAPLLLLLHGSGRDSASILSPWQSLAKKERIVLVAPDSLNQAGWSIGTDGPDFFHQIIEEVGATGSVDPRRMYIFGHSAGGHHAMDLALLESEYFAAAAVHAGVLMEPGAIIPRAERKIPVGMWNGIEDRTVPIEAARSTLNTLKKSGFPVVLTEMPRHTHDYYESAAKVNAEAWEMLKTTKLSADPKFKSYTIR